jgi:hypothetical protein
MSDAFDGFHGIRQSLNVPGLASHSNNFQAIIMIQVDMLGRNDDFLKIVLNIIDSVQERLLMMIINDGDGPGDFPTFFPFLFDQFLPDEITKRFRTVGIFSRSDQTIKFIQKRFI